MLLRSIRSGAVEAVVSNMEAAQESSLRRSNRRTVPHCLFFATLFTVLLYVVVMHLSTAFQIAEETHIVEPVKKQDDPTELATEPELIPTAATSPSSNISVVLISRSQHLPWNTLDVMRAAVGRAEQRRRGLDGIHRVEVVVVYTHQLSATDVSQVEGNSTFRNFVKFVPSMSNDTFPSYAELCRVGYEAVHPSSTHLLFLNDAHVPSSPHFLEEMYKPFAQSLRVGAVQATVLATDSLLAARWPDAPPDEMTPHDGKMVVVDRGFEVVLAFPSTGFDVTPYITRRYGGYSAADSRFRVTERVPLVSLYALMVDRGVYRRSRGFTINSTVPLGHRLDEERLYDSFSSASERKSFFRRTRYFWHESWRAEEESGWDFAMRVHLNNFTLSISSATVTLNEQILPEFVRPHFPGFVTYLPAGAFSVTWSSLLYQLHGSMRPGARKPPLRVVWYSACCGCCGFGIEILHYMLPLHRKHQLLLTNSDPFRISLCLCPGFPSSVRDTFKRIQISDLQFASQTLSHGEIIVWIAHTIPQKFVGTVAQNRIPDYFVGRSMYEFTVVDPSILSNFSLADEIWVPSTFVQKAFQDSGVAADKIVVIPESLDPYFFDPEIHTPIDLPLRGKHAKWRQYCNKEQPSSATPYRFFSNFKWEPRKGWEILFEAYHRAFSNVTGNHQPVSLYVLTVLYQTTSVHEFDSRDPGPTGGILPQLLSAMRLQLGIQSLSEMPHFCLITEALDTEDLARLYRSADAFVLPTRGEGWGLPMMEAMSMGLPTISTAWGGSVDFMSPNASFLIDVDDVVELPKDSPYGYLPGKKWAVPSVRHTAQLMRHVHEDQEHARVVGARARRHILEHFSEENVADIVDAQLSVIHEVVMRRRFLSSRFPELIDIAGRRYRSSLEDARAGEDNRVVKLETSHETAHETAHETTAQVSG